MRPLLPLLLALALTSALLPLPAPLSDFILPPDIAYHNSATLGACPRVVINNATDEWTAMERDPADLYFGGSATEPSCVSKMAAVRAAAAAFIGATPNEVALVPSTTVAINAVAEGLVASGFLRAGDVVLQSDQEHMGGRSGFLHYSRLGFFSIEYFAIPMHGSTAHSLLASIAAALTPSTRVVCLSHITTTTGIRLPIKQIAALLRPKNILLVVDGAQSAGAIAVDMRDLAADVCAYPPPLFPNLLSCNSLCFVVLTLVWQLLHQRAQVAARPQRQRHHVRVKLHPAPPAIRPVRRRLRALHWRHWHTPVTHHRRPRCRPQLHVVVRHAQR
jgi:hypothetical protein